MNDEDWLQTGWRLIKKNRREILIFCLGILAGFLICGRFYYTKSGSEVIRINRITGTPYRLTYEGWVQMQKMTAQEFLDSP
jgi:hypothetical protein